MCQISYDFTCIKGHFHTFISLTWCGRSYSLPKHSSQHIMSRPAVSEALVLLLCEDIFGLKAPERLISADRDGQDRRQSAPTDLSGRCWLLRRVSFVPRQHPSFTRSVLSPRVIVLVGVSGETRPERGRRRLRLTAGGRNWADVSFKVGQGWRCVGMRCFPPLLPS